MISKQLLEDLVKKIWSKIKAFHPFLQPILFYCALIHLPWLQMSVLKLGNFCLWIPQSRALESEIQLKRLESRVQSGIQVSLTEFGIQ